MNIEISKFFCIDLPYSQYLKGAFHNTKFVLHYLRGCDILLILQIWEIVFSCDWFLTNFSMEYFESMSTHSILDMDNYYKVKVVNISFSSSNTQFYESQIFRFFTFWVFFPDKSFKLILKYTQKCQYNSLKKKKKHTHTLGKFKFGVHKIECSMNWTRY